MLVGIALMYYLQAVDAILYDLTQQVTSPSCVANPSCDDTGHEPFV